MRTTTGNRELMRQINTSLVLGALREADGISQVELSRQTRLSAGTITSIVRDLRKEGFIKEVGRGRSAIGRRPVLLRLDRRARHVIGVELTAENTRVAVMDLSARIEDETRYRTDAPAGPRAAVERLCAEARALLKKNGIPPDRVPGIGLALEGVLDARQERLLRSGNLGWRDAPIKELVEAESGLPATLSISAAAMAFGEYHYGVGQESYSMVCLDVDSGVGAVPVIDGRIVRGVHSMAGQLGHTLAVSDGATCVCGRKGCLETVASGISIVAATRKAMAADRASALSGAFASCPASEAIAMMGEAARDGDALCREAFEAAGTHLGVAAAAIVNLLDPELIVLTGFVTFESRGELLRVIRRVVPRHMADSALRSVRIEEGVLKEDAAVIGVGAMICEEAFRAPVDQPRALGIAM